MTAPLLPPDLDDLERELVEVSTQARAAYASSLARTQAGAAAHAAPAAAATPAAAPVGTAPAVTPSASAAPPAASAATAGATADTSPPVTPRTPPHPPYTTAAAGEPVELDEMDWAPGAVRTLDELEAELDAEQAAVEQRQSPFAEPDAAARAAKAPTRDPALAANPHLGRWRQRLAEIGAAAPLARPMLRSGRLTRAAGLVLEAVGIRLPVGAGAMIELPPGNALKMAEAEVVGFSGERLFLMPTSEVAGLLPGARVFPLEVAPVDDPHAGQKRLPVGFGMLGRVVDSAGRPLDQLGPLNAEANASLHGTTINPLTRDPIHEVLDVGVRAINALLTVGRGQRMGLFAGSGVGKSVLLGMMARYTSADVIVVGLIGERGREVKEFIEQILGREGLARAVVVAAPADVTPLMRLQGAAYATTLAEYFRDQGKNVLLIMDSLTRYAMAQREISLAIGEPPATKGYPPSVFAKLPALVERTGNGPRGRRLDHRVLHGADRGRRPAGPDRRLGARDPRRPRRALALARGVGPLSGDRHRGVDQPRDGRARQRQTVRRRAPLQADAVALPAQPRPDRGGRVCGGARCADRPSDRDVPAARSVSPAEDAGAQQPREQPRATGLVVRTGRSLIE